MRSVSFTRNSRAPSTKLPHGRTRRRARTAAARRSAAAPRRRARWSRRAAPTARGCRRGLAAGTPRRWEVVIRAPIRSSTSRTRSGRVEADVVDRDLRAGEERRRHDERRGRREIARAPRPRRRQALGGPDRAAGRRWIGAPAAASMISVWSRVGTGSVTEVRPSAQRPASRTADFTWALATGSS